MNSIESNFVPYQIAVDMKSIGFDEECFSFYEYNGELYKSEGYYKRRYNVNEHNEVIAPTYSQAFRFFREKYNLSSWIYNSDMINFFYTILQGGRIVKANNSYESYEEAELAAIVKLIEIVKSK